MPDKAQQKRRTNRVFKSLHKPLTYLGVERTLFYFVCVSAVGAFNLFNSILAFRVGNKEGSAAFRDSILLRCDLLDQSTFSEKCHGPASAIANISRLAARNSNLAIFCGKTKMQRHRLRGRHSCNRRINGQRQNWSQHGVQLRNIHVLASLNKTAGDLPGNSLARPTYTLSICLAAAITEVAVPYPTLAGHASWHS
jgi:hypothetical protein